MKPEQQINIRSTCGVATLKKNIPLMYNLVLCAKFLIKKGPAHYSAHTSKFSVTCISLFYLRLHGNQHQSFCKMKRITEHSFELSSPC